MSQNQKENFSCSKCNKQFVNKGTLNKHMQYHTGKFSAYCDTCRRGFPNVGHFKEHMRSHQGLKYHCEYCSKPFTSTKRLRYHTSVHTGEYRFTCQKCGQGFNEKNVLEKHMNSHL